MKLHSILATVLTQGIQYFQQTRLGLQQLPTRLLNPSAVIQAALPAIFKNVPESFFAQTMEVFENNAKTSYSILSKVPGLHPVMPAGSMFIMVCKYSHCHNTLSDQTLGLDQLCSKFCLLFYSFMLAVLPIIPACLLNN